LKQGERINEVEQGGKKMQKFSTSEFGVWPLTLSHDHIGLHSMLLCFGHGTMLAHTAVFWSHDCICLHSGKSVKNSPLGKLFGAAKKQNFWECGNLQVMDCLT
jgi:hypothetical protein